MNPLLLDPQLALGRELVFNAVFELLSKLSLSNDVRAQREREEPRGADLTLACVLEQDSNTTLHWLLSCSNTSTA